MSFGLEGITGGAFALAAARQQRNFIKEMRRTAYQTTMEDMRKAGLNPILAYRQGPTTSAQAQQAMTPKMGLDIGAMVKAGAARSQAASAAGIRAEQIRSEKMRQLMLKGQAAQGFSAANLNDRNAEMITTGLPAAHTQREFDESGPGRFAIKARRALQGGSAVMNAASRAGTAAILGR